MTVNAFTIDLEPWMCISEAYPLIKELDFNITPLLTEMILDLLDRCHVKATFFILGKIFEWHPDLVKEIAHAGHEIAFHTYLHRIVTNAKILEEEIKLAHKFLTLFKPRGFRAPRITMPRAALKVLAKYGFKYSSSTYAPIGKPIKCVDGIIEVPVSTYPLLKKEVYRAEFPRTLIHALKAFEIPFGSGLFIGLVDTTLLNRMIKSFNRMGRSVVMFIHPWQIKHGRTKFIIKVLLKDSKSLPYIFAKISLRKLLCILSNHYFTTISDLLKEYRYI